MIRNKFSFGLFGGDIGQEYFYFITAGLLMTISRKN